ncbi:tRNA lysidine(34) synthetase TilS [Cohaesibacter sp. CAU 1516]|uniref:tRNA lysidine(34) synthetase TilS n=1 Tax=Cohaesibacter sp. CAU 1516 TaxID=2576038 RepID=UPI0014851DF1|nr:tRNA lysidine(34) synthetase TilS [Cohaesibacter sp. CAU 1516]
MPNARQSGDATAPPPSPLTLEELDALFAPLLRLKSVLLAVSGGADSLSLMFLCHHWQQARAVPLSLHVASVDHGLRAEATAECAFVADEAAALGLSHFTLVWTPPLDLSNLQAKARVARYQLLADQARRLGCSHIILAHHLDDQAETLIMRLLRGSGVTGLGAMRPEQKLDELTLLRPFLSVPKTRLRASLEAMDKRWVDDPSNHQDAYQRVRVRQWMPMLAAEGCDAERLAATARRMQRADAALEAMSEQSFHSDVEVKPGRSLRLSLDGLSSHLEEVRLRIWRRCIDYVAGAAYPPREEKLLALDLAYVRCNSERDGKRTFGGCCFEPDGHDLWIYRELGRDPFTRSFRAGDPIDWPGLYKTVSVSGMPPHAEGALKPLGRHGVCLMEQEGQFLASFRAYHGDLPMGLIEALPSVWFMDKPVFVKDWTDLSELSGIRVEFQEK